MGYFNYFIKCLIRRFVRLFFTKKTFIIILIFISLFFLRSEGYCSSEILLNRSSVSLYTNPDMFQVADTIVSTSSSSSTINNLTFFYVYYLQPGHTYRFDYDLSNSFNCKISYDLSFSSLLSDSYDNKQTYITGSDSSSTTGFITGSSSGSGLINESVSLNTNGSSSYSFIDNSGKYVTVYSLSYFGFSSGAVFTPSVGYYVLLTDKDVTLSSLRLYEITDYATSDDVNNQTNTIVSSSQATQNTIKDTSQQMQNTITDDNVVVNTDLPQDSTNDITADGFNNIFTTIRTAFTSSAPKDLIVPIPFTEKSFIINYNNVYDGMNLGFVLDLVTLFWWTMISLFIVKDISNKINKIKSGNFESIENTNIKEDLL